MIKQKLLSTLLFSVFALLAACEQERPTNEAAAPEPRLPDSSIGAPIPSQVLHSATGSVTVIDRKAEQITIAHDPISTLNWPSMTMSFAIKDASLLKDIKTGDKITFILAEGDNQRYVIQEIRRQ